MRQSIAIIMIMNKEVLKTVGKIISAKFICGNAAK